MLTQGVPTCQFGGHGLFILLPHLLFPFFEQAFTDHSNLSEGEQWLFFPSGGNTSGGRSWADQTTFLWKVAMFLMGPAGLSGVVCYSTNLSCWTTGMATLENSSPLTDGSLHLDASSSECVCTPVWCYWEFVLVGQKVLKKRGINGGSNSVVAPIATQLNNVWFRFNIVRYNVLIHSPQIPRLLTKTGQVVNSQLYLR